MTDKRAVHISFPKDVLDQFEKVCNRKGVTLGTGLRRLAAYGGKKSWVPPKMQSNDQRRPLSSLSNFQLETLNKNDARKQTQDEIWAASKYLSRQVLLTSPQDKYFQKGASATLKLAITMYLTLKPILFKYVSEDFINRIAGNDDDKTQDKIIAEMMNELGFREFFHMANVMASDQSFTPMMSKHIQTQLQIVAELAGNMQDNVRAIYLRAGRLMMAFNINMDAGTHQFTSKMDWIMSYSNYLKKEQTDGFDSFGNMPLKHIIDHNGITVKALRNFKRVKQFILPYRSGAVERYGGSALLEAGFILMLLTHNIHALCKPFKGASISHSASHKLFTSEIDYLYELKGILEFIPYSEILKLLDQVWSFTAGELGLYLSTRTLHNQVRVNIRMAKFIIDHLSESTTLMCRDSVVTALGGRISEIKRDTDARPSTSWPKFIATIDRITDEAKHHGYGD